MQIVTTCKENKVCTAEEKESCLWLLRRNPNNHELILVLSELLDQEEFKKYLEDLKCMPIIKEQVRFKLYKDNLDSLLAVYSKLNNGYVL